MVATLSAMTPNKQRRALTLICSKLAVHGLSSETAPVHMHLLPKWILLADNTQCTPPSNAIIPTEQTTADIPGKQRVADIPCEQRVPLGIPLQCITNAHSS
jgi:hypothetical protein